MSNFVKGQKVFIVHKNDYRIEEAPFVRELEVNYTRMIDVGGDKLYFGCDIAPNREAAIARLKDHCNFSLKYHRESLAKAEAFLASLEAPEVPLSVQTADEAEFERQSGETIKVICGE